MDGQAVRPRTGGEILIDTLQRNGTDTVFCVPGESFLAAIDALHQASNAIKTVVTRHEGGAAHMAEAYGKLTGKPGICFVTRGPGATHASIGVHTASQDSTPLVLFIGQVNSGWRGREAWQEVDFDRMFGGMAKWVVEIDRPERIPELVTRALHIAVSGRPGPVVVALPEDVLARETVVADCAPHQRAHASPSAAHIGQLKDLLDGAERPIVILGGGGWDDAACADIKSFIEAFDLPVAAGFRRQDLIDNGHPNYVGHAGLGPNPKLVARIQSSDLIIAIGGRLGETTTSGYTMLGVPQPSQTLVHVHADALELGRVYQAALMIHSGMREFAATAAQLRPGRVPPWRELVKEARQDLEQDQLSRPMPGSVNLSDVMLHIRDVMPADVFISNGAGNYAIWVHKLHRYGGFRTQLAPTSGAMGYGLPAALAAKVVHPEREAICFAGDGCFLMSGQELATGVQYRLGVIVIVVNNGMYGSIRMHQEKEFPGRVHATMLENPDFVALAKAYGAFGELVESTEAFGPALARAREFAGSQRKPALLELRVDPEAITPTATLAGLRKAAQAAGHGAKR